MVEFQGIVTPIKYAEWRATVLGRITEKLEIRTIFDLAGTLAGKRVLDVGTGRQGRLETLPVKDGAFDVVIAVSSVKASGSA